MPCVVAADGDRDSMPVVVKEAMAMEVCVVASDEVGLPEVVREPWGRLAPPGDHVALAEAIGALLDRPPAERVAAGRAAREHVLEWANADHEAAKLSTFIRAAQVARA
jgi:glycosyltransferase involved in cell wall biosynthesis